MLSKGILYGGAAYVAIGVWVASRERALKATGAGVAAGLAIAQSLPTPNTGLTPFNPQEIVFWPIVLAGGFD